MSSSGSLIGISFVAQQFDGVVLANLIPMLYYYIYTFLKGVQVNKNLFVY